MESQKLLFVPSTNSWAPITFCVWAPDENGFPEGKIPILTPYTSLEKFFTRILGVRKPNVSTKLDGLRRLLTQKASVASLKKCLVDISSAIILPEHLEPFHDSPIIPVRLPCGQTRLVTPKDDFLIVDRNEYREPFKNLLTVLDFSVWEVRACENLLVYLGLSSKFLSRRVDKTTFAKDFREETQLTADLRMKAEAISRYVKQNIAILSLV